MIKRILVSFAFAGFFTGTILAYNIKDIVKDIDGFQEPVITSSLQEEELPAVEEGTSLGVGIVIEEEKTVSTPKPTYQPIISSPSPSPSPQLTQEEKQATCEARWNAINEEFKPRIEEIQSQQASISRKTIDYNCGDANPDDCRTRIESEKRVKEEENNKMSEKLHEVLYQSEKAKHDAKVEIGC